jgi:hypothetical protein
MPDTVNGMQPPRQLSLQAIEEFKRIYQEEFGRDISNDDAQEIGLRLLRLFGILLNPPPGDMPGPAGISERLS